MYQSGQSSNCIREMKVMTKRKSSDQKKHSLRRKWTKLTEVSYARQKKKEEKKEKEKEEKKEESVFCH